MPPIPRAVHIAVLLLAIAPGVPVLASDGGAEDSYAPARENISRWMETNRLMIKERKDWQDAKALIEARIELLNQEAASIEEKIAAVEESFAAAAREKADLVSRNESLREASAALAASAAQMEADVRALHRRLPEPAQAKVAPLFGRIPADPAQTSVSPAERFQNIVGIVNEINKLNGEITLAAEVRTLSGGKPGEVKVVYIGLGQAYYAGAHGEAGVGRPGPDGWTWEPAPEVAASVLETVEILMNKATPRFVPLPVEIQ